ncbi:arginase family protein, partial [Streptomyces nigrescens]
MRRTVLIDAPSNLGLRPPAPGTVPGCYKLAGALREQGLLRRLGALEGGVVVPPRYDLGEWKEGDGDFNAAALAAYTSRLATRIEGHVGSGDFPVVLGGDCSILLGAVLALRRLGRYGVAYLDGHGDFRHPGNTAVSGPVGAAAGEGVAQITGRGQEDLTDLDGLRPYVRDEDVCVLGIRDADEDQE